MGCAMTDVRTPIALMTKPALAELAELDQWVIWEYVTWRGKQDKPPSSVATGDYASHSAAADR
jgi:hypothetical protein